HPGRTEVFALSLHDALPILLSDGVGSLSLSFALRRLRRRGLLQPTPSHAAILDAPSSPARLHLCGNECACGEGELGCSAHQVWRSEEHTSELQSRSDLVCRL